MFGPWIALWGWLKGVFPNRASFTKPHFNFITIHYIYLISMSIIGSIMLYPAGGLAYIDALLFASGASTQSGLNPIDINTITLYQQVVIFLLACVCNPIFINTLVVFVRLYWFEKRFQNVVQEARNFRRTRTRSQAKSEPKADHDIGREETGVGTREIRVLRAADGHAKGNKIEEQIDGFVDLKASDDEEKGGSSDRATSSSANGPVAGSVHDISNDSLDDDSTQEVTSPTKFHRDIVFADELGPRDVRPSHARALSNLEHMERIPEQRSKEQHIAWVENQRNPKDKVTLRIPGPRDFDRGDLPQRLDDEEAALDKQTSHEQQSHGVRRSMSMPPTELNADDHPLKQNITINEPDHPRRPTTGISAFSFNKRSTTTGQESTIMTLRQRARSRTFGSFITKTENDEDPMPYLSWTPTVGRNSAFVDLTEDQREELGGIEYRALKLLALILVCMICLLPWVVRESQYVAIIEADGANPVWWGFFTPASLFNDLGFTLTPDSMISFNEATFVLLLGTFLIIIGNTGFPCMLRFVIWMVEKCVPHGSAVWEELRFLLDHPRRCFTLLFPSKANWWLFWILVALNAIDLIFFIILDLNDPTVTSLPVGYRILDGLFQAAATRTAGFAVVNLADLHPAIQVSYLIMMYISVFPIAISMRNTNVYEEKSLGVWASADTADDQPNSYLSAHLRRQLSFDLWFVFLGFFLIAIIEGGRLENTNDYAFTLFSVLFEIVSAYGTVGLSLGYPGFNTSFCGQFRTLSKLIIIAMEIRGRHRGLPYALDRAILLPSESLHKKEDADATRRARRGSHASAVDGEELMRPQSTRRSSTYSGHGEDQSPAVTGRAHASTGQGLTRLLSQALSASPTVQREKKA